MLVPGAVAATIFAFALGSSSVEALNEAGKTIRWLVLFALVGLAALWTARTPARRTLPAVVVAAGAFFVGLAALSAAWSVDPSLTLGRATSVGVLFAGAGLIALAGGPDRVLLGALAGAAAVAAAGLVLLAVAPGTAVDEATVGVAARFRGFGENPNTVALLLSVAFPLAVWVALERSRRAGLALILVFAASIAASGSRGAVGAALAGTLVVIALRARTPRSGAVLGVAAVMVALAAVAAGRVPQPAAPEPAGTVAPAAEPERFRNVEQAFPLHDDVGRSLPGGGQVEQPRGLLGTSGRRAAWGAAIEQAAARPALGHGFGTEDRVFVDRYANFAGGVPENSYIGLFLQLGAVGLAALVLLIAAVAAAGRAALRAQAEAAASAGVVTAGLVAALVQSYMYSVGNVATATFWIAVFLLAAAGPREQETPAPTL